MDSIKVFNPKILKCKYEIKGKSEEAIQQDLKQIQSLVSGPKLMLITVFWQPADKNHNNIGGGWEEAVGGSGWKGGGPYQGSFLNQSEHRVPAEKGSLRNQRCVFAQIQL